jgi:hypothetical protein
MTPRAFAAIGGPSGLIVIFGRTTPGTATAAG